jgi:hypothetical protein
MVHLFWACSLVMRWAFRDTCWTSHRSRLGNTFYEVVILHRCGSLFKVGFLNLWELQILTLTPWIKFQIWVWSYNLARYISKIFMSLKFSLLPATFSLTRRFSYIICFWRYIRYGHCRFRICGRNKGICWIWSATCSVRYSVVVIYRRLGFTQFPSGKQTWERVSLIQFPVIP